MKAERMSADGTERSLQKIRSHDLREEARTASLHSETVIVELEVPATQIAFAELPHFGAGRMRPMIVSPTSSGDETVRAVRDALENVLGRSPGRYLASSHAFILDMTGEQLRQVAQIPEVRAIWPNTTRF